MLHDCQLLAGFHDLEQDDLGPFVWTQGSFRLKRARRARFAQLKLCYLGSDGQLTIRAGQDELDRVALGQGWQNCAVRLDTAVAGEPLECSLQPVIPVAGDPRELGVMLRGVELFDDPRRYEILSSAARNLQLNTREYLSGQTVLDSCPPMLRITMEVRCNIPETGQACTYCAWDWAKESERGSPRFTLDSLGALGDFYRSANEVTDCSIGEPTMNREFGPIIAQLDQDGKQCSLTSNGQLLTPARRRDLLGKNVLLYVSIDSATAEGYARYRNQRFDDIIRNLKALCQEKKAHSDLPWIYVSFIAMHSNVAELPQFFALMREVGVDMIKLRTLYLDENVAPQSMNNGYVFDYASELLHVDELAALAPVARQLAQQHGMPLHVEWEQFVADVGATNAPMCSEPWKTLYVLRRGIMPCCYATQPLATWDQQQGRPLDEFLHDVFNGAAYQEIREGLAEGRLSDYCRNTPSCPILKRDQQRGVVTVPLNSFQQRGLGASPQADPLALPLVPLENLTRADRDAA